VILTLVWLGIFAAINPSTSKLILPYAIIYMAATLSPLILRLIIGEPLADLSYLIVSQAIGLPGIPITQTGRTLQLISKKGEIISFTVSPDCSSISSITVFLLLCGLMHLDLKKKKVHTLMLALLGTLALIILNAIRIIILVWTGYLGGDWAMWNTHSWLGYAIMISFYAVATKIYISLK
jgi:exosortase/archaeosortase family protein